MITRRGALDRVVAVAAAASVRAGLAESDAPGYAVPEGYSLVWHDEFNNAGAPNPKNWTYEHGFVRNEELQWYQPQNAFCTGGNLIIEARRQTVPNPNYRPGNRDWRFGRQTAPGTRRQASRRAVCTIGNMAIL